MRKALLLVLLMLTPLTGCFGMEQENSPYDIFFDTEQFWLEYSFENWEMAHEYVKNPQNETTSSTLYEFSADFSETESYNPDYWIDHLWLAPNDGSPAEVVDANTSRRIAYLPQGYGAFNLRLGLVLNTGDVYLHGQNPSLPNNSLDDFAPFIRSAQFEFEENQVTEFAELFVDGPHEASLGPPQSIRVESTVSNVADLQFDASDVTWTVYGPDGTMLGEHTENVAYGASFTWEWWYDENVPFGDITIVIEGDGSVTLSQSTGVRMSYSGFMCHSETARPCPR